MEIIDYVRQLGWRLLILLVVPLVAVLVGGVILASQPTQYKAVATVRLPVGTSASSSVITQANSDFTQALHSDAVLTTSSQATGVSKGTISSGLSVAQSGGSRTVDVTYTADNQSTVVPVVKEASRSALNELLTPAVAIDQHAVDSAQQSYDAARATLNDLSGQDAGVLPDDRYRQVLSQLNSLQVQLVAANAANGATDSFGHVINNTHEIATYQAAIAAAQAELSKLNALVQQVGPLEDKVASAKTNLTAAKQVLLTDQAALASVDTPGTIVISAAVKIDPVKSAAKTLAVIGAVALVLSIAILVAWELLSPSSRKRGKRAARKGASTHKPSRAAVDDADDLDDVRV